MRIKILIYCLIVILFFKKGIPATLAKTVVTPKIKKTVQYLIKRKILPEKKVDQFFDSADLQNDDAIEIALRWYGLKPMENIDQFSVPQGLRDRFLGSEDLEKYDKSIFWSFEKNKWLARRINLNVLSSTYYVSFFQVVDRDSFVSALVQTLPSYRPVQKKPLPKSTVWVDPESIPYLSFALEKKFITDKFFDRRQPQKTFELYETLKKMLVYNDGNVSVINFSPASFESVEAISNCPIGSHNNDGRCIPNTLPCIIENGTAVKLWIVDTNLKRDRYTQCIPLSCDPYYLEKDDRCLKRDYLLIIKEDLEKDQIPPKAIIEGYASSAEGQKTFYGEFLNVIREAMNVSDQNQQVKIIYSWITNHISYDIVAYDEKKLHNGHPSYTWWGALENKIAVCNGFAELFSKALSILGIQNTIVRGFTDSFGRHAWNKAFVEGKWYYFDPTWDSADPDISGKFKSGATLKYFFLKKECIRFDHVEENEVPFQSKELQDFFELNEKLLEEFCPHVYDKYGNITDFNRKVNSINLPPSLSSDGNGHFYLFYDPSGVNAAKLQEFFDHEISRKNYKKIILHKYNWDREENITALWDAVDLVGYNGGAVQSPFVIFSNYATTITWGSWGEDLMGRIMEKCEKDVRYCPPLNINPPVQ